MKEETETPTAPTTTVTKPTHPNDALEYLIKYFIGDIPIRR